jgi:hypothetical protein
MESHKIHVPNHQPEILVVLPVKALCASARVVERRTMDGLLIVIGIERLGLSASTMSRAKGTEDFEEI